MYIKKYDQITEIMNVMLKLSFLLIILVSLALLCVCDQAITPSERIEGYYLSGAIIKSLDMNFFGIKVAFKRNDTAISNAKLWIGNDTLSYAAGYYTKIFDSLTHLSIGNHYLNLVDSTLFSDSVMFSIASDFEITSKIPAGDAPLTPGNMVQVEWSTPTYVDGYIYSAIKTDEVYGVGGYSAFVTTGVTSTSFNSDAFALPSGELDTGWYSIYIYGYKDSPVPGTALPTVFPDGLSNSISKLDFTGKFGSLVVTRRDSIHAVTQ